MTLTMTTREPPLICGRRGSRSHCGQRLGMMKEPRAYLTVGGTPATTEKEKKNEKADFVAAFCSLCLCRTRSRASRTKGCRRPQVRQTLDERVSDALDGSRLYLRRWMAALIWIPAAVGCWHPVACRGAS